MYLHVGRTALHSLNLCSKVWSSYFNNVRTAIIPTYYIICNNTNESVRIGQVGIPPGHALKKSQEDFIFHHD